MITENLSTLKIHKLTQEQYDRELEAGRVDPSAIYLTPDDGDNSNIYIQNEEPIDAEEGSLWVDMDAVGTVGGSYSAEIPIFNLTEMGLPDIPIDGSIVQCECDTAELRAALKQGMVKLKSRVNNGEYAFESECLAMHTMSVDEDIHQTVVRGMLWGKVYEFIMWVYSDRIMLTCVEANSGSLGEGEDSNDVLIVNFDTQNLKSSHTATEIHEAINQGKIVCGKSGYVFYTLDCSLSNIFKGQYATFYNFNLVNSQYKEYHITAITVWDDASISYDPFTYSCVPTVVPQTPKGAVLTVTDSKLAWVLPEESGAPDAILYTAQDLTEEQKSQARQNIGIPTPTESDYGKVLSATAEGLKWVTPSGGSGNVPSAEGVGF